MGDVREGVQRVQCGSGYGRWRAAVAPYSLSFAPSPARLILPAPLSVSNIVVAKALLEAAVKQVHPSSHLTSCLRSPVKGSVRATCVAHNVFLI
jgi:hypothetical protein